MKRGFLSQSNSAELNRNSVLRYVKGCIKTSRTEIWSSMNISRASVTQIIRELEETGFVRDTGEKKPGMRRMSRYLCFNNNVRFMYIFNWSSRSICLVNLGGDVLKSLVLEFPHGCIPAQFVAIVLNGIERLEKLYPVSEELILGLGIILPGIIDSRHLKVIYSVEMGWRNVDISELFQERFDGKLFLERWSNMLALGENIFGATRNYTHSVLVLIENEGVGLSSVIRGDCHHGSNYMFGELGHIKLQSSVMCSCGQRGCLEAVIRESMSRNNNILTDEVMEYMAIGVSTAVNLLDPGIVLLYGKLLSSLTKESQEKLLNRILSKITSEQTRSLKLVISQDDGLIGVKGMSAYIYDCSFPI